MDDVWPRPGGQEQGCRGRAHSLRDSKAQHSPDPHQPAGTLRTKALFLPRVTQR